MPNAAFLELSPPKTKLTLVDKVFYRRQLPSDLYADFVATHTVLARVPHTQLLFGKCSPRMDRVIEISNWRPNRIEAIIADHTLGADPSHGHETVGAIKTHLVADEERFRTTTLGPILRDSNGKLWVQFPDSLQTPDDSRLAYLASDIAKLESIAKLNVGLVQTASIPRSRQHERVAAERAYADWVRENDPLCMSDDRSFWNRMNDGDV